VKILYHYIFIHINWDGCYKNNDRIELYKLLIYNEYIISLKYEHQTYDLRKCHSDFIFDEIRHLLINTWFLLFNL